MICSSPGSPGVADTGTPEAAPAVPVTVDIVISDESLAGGHAPAEVSADGVPAETIPAEVARNLIAQSIDHPAAFPHQGDG